MSWSRWSKDCTLYTYPTWPLDQERAHGWIEVYEICGYSRHATAEAFNAEIDRLLATDGHECPDPDAIKDGALEWSQQEHWRNECATHHMMWWHGECPSDGQECRYVDEKPALTGPASRYDV